MALLNTSPVGIALKAICYKIVSVHLHPFEASRFASTLLVESAAGQIANFSTTTKRQFLQMLLRLLRMLSRLVCERNSLPVRVKETDDLNASCFPIPV